jgi:RNA polymerase sigma factor (sigma-70 family)
LSNELSDIIAGCQRKKYRHQKKLYDLYASLLYGICKRYLKDVDDANDALQEAFIKVYEKIVDYRGEGSFEGWIKRVQVNICLMQLRKQKKKWLFESSRIEDIEDMEAMSDLEEGEQESGAMLGIPPEKLFECIQGLSKGYRTVFNMYVLDGFTHQEIAEKLSISAGTSKSQLARAKKKLKQELQATAK